MAMAKDANDPGMILPVKRPAGTYAGIVARDGGEQKTSSGGSLTMDTLRQALRDIEQLAPPWRPLLGQAVLVMSDHVQLDHVYVMAPTPDLTGENTTSVVINRIAWQRFLDQHPGENEARLAREVAAFYLHQAQTTPRAIQG
jgi:hypothetical protein